MLARRTLAAAALACWCIAPTVTAWAQAETGDPKEQSRAHFERGNQLLADGALDAALAEFQRSRQLFPTRGNTQNAAVALGRLGRYVEALEMYRTLLHDFDLDPTERQTVDREMDMLSKLVGSLIVRAEPGA